MTCNFNNKIFLNCKKQIIFEYLKMAVEGGSRERDTCIPMADSC